MRDLSLVWWHTPVIPALEQAEAGASPWVLDLPGVQSESKRAKNTNPVSKNTNSMMTHPLGT